MMRSLISVDAIAAFGNVLQFTVIDHSRFGLNWTTKSSNSASMGINYGESIECRMLLRFRFVHQRIEGQLSL